jgi:KDO2-lipid IV(A) lauroyltransferase
MLKYLALLLPYKLLGWLPTPAAYFIADRAATVAYYLRGGLRRNVQQNIRQVMGPDASPEEVRAAAKKAFRNVTRAYADLILVPRLNVRRFFEKNLTTHGLEYLTDTVASGKGVILVSAHYGNPELVVQAAGALGIEAFAITEPLQPQALSDLVHRLRCSKGQVFRPVSVSTMKEAVRWLREGKLVSVLCDRDIQHTGTMLPFCGAEARLPIGTAQLAMRTGAVVLPMFSRRTRGNHFEVYTEPPLTMTITDDEANDVRVNTLKIISCIEKYLRLDPGQWLVLEPIWRERDGQGTQVDSPVESVKV